MDQPSEPPATTPAAEPPPPTPTPPAEPTPAPPPPAVPTGTSGPSGSGAGTPTPEKPSPPPKAEEKKDDTKKSQTSLGKDKGGDAEKKESEPKAPEPEKVQTVSKEISEARSKLPTNKAIDFQVRVRVIEGRNIAGSNVSPVVKVSVSNQARQTRVKKSTNKPFFDEIFFFNFKTVAEELFDSMMTFEVLNSRKLRFDSLIGTFSIDVGFFYDQKDHSIIRRWLLLTDPEDIMGGVKGYLKVTVMVLGPGDEAPEIPEAFNEDDEDDLEENLLQPAGFMLRPAAFCLKIFRAEDIPQMDSAFTENLKKVFNIGEKSKALVDPYALMSFAGKQCKTKYLENDDQPEFNQELSVRFQMPSMCEKIKLQLWDWDKLSPDDVVGTTYLPLSVISGEGDTQGFLPTFGPCFVNLYGSTREFSTVRDELEYLNDGTGEGVAYRGRMLIELETKVAGEMNTGVEDLEDTDIVLVQPYLRRRKYKLFGCFLEATMIACKDIPLQFEISIGNYGNRLDQSVAPSSSSTPASNAVFDGCYYYFLPWGRNKPCCSVDSHWEDISFRLYSMNILKNMVENLENNIARVKIGIKQNLSTGELAALVMELLEELILNCRKPLPVVNNTIPNVNDLDLKRYNAREKEKKAIGEAAIKLRESATDIIEALADIEGFHQRLEALTVEPQNSMPDVIIWMLSGSKRIAYYRVPANEILYSNFDKASGKHCGKVQNIFMKYPGEKQFDIEDHPEIPCQISVILWLGLEREQESWTNRSDTEGDFCVFAETYENMAKFLGKWTTKGLTRPAWSDAEGTVKLLKENFVLPRGWRWDGDWIVNPELSLSFEPDTGHKSYLDDVFGCESRLPGDNWEGAAIQWTDIYGNATHGPNEVECPEDWEWTMKWTVDCNRAVDENGWEYSVQPDAGSYIPVEKTYHLHRRRRLVRNRRMIQSPAPRDDEEEISDILEEGGWEYATAFSLQFRCKERKVDMVRRRRWHRRMIQEDPTAPAVFRRTGIDATSEPEGGKKKKEKEKADSTDVPRMMIVFDSPHKFQLRVYLFQARDLLPADADGLSDPYARVVFLNHSQVTHSIHRTLCPTWDQTLVFEDVFIFGSTELLQLKPPEVVIELFDKDQVGKDDYLGRCVAEPTVKLNGQVPPAPRLLWYPVMKGKEEGGEILATFELFLDEGADLPYLPPMNEGRYIVPSGIRPVLQRTAIEVLCWGVRNMKKYQLANVTSPSVEFECGGHVIHSDAIKNTNKNPNFDQPLFFFDVFLPKEELYVPPMNIKIRDNRSFGRRPIVGIHCLRSLQQYRFQTPKDESISEQESEEMMTDAAYELSIKEDTKRSEQVIFDWWSKYYASIGALDKAEGYLESGNDTLILQRYAYARRQDLIREFRLNMQFFTSEEIVFLDEACFVYPTDLERIAHFKQFQDFVETFPLYRGKVKSGNKEDMTDVGEFKGTFRVYPLPSDPGFGLPPKILHNLPSSQPVECVIRVYIIKGIDLQPMDSNGLADPYVKITLGKQKISDHDNYIPNTLNPIIGKMFELTALIPIAKDLKISVYDYDMIGQDDLIGETNIDLENRFLSRFRATCGLPTSYYTSGKNQWRDSLKPKQILEKLCEVERTRPPKYLGNTRMIFKERIYTTEEFEEGMTISPDLGPPDERLALHVLNGEPLVPEHIETRSLYSSLQPNIEQGKLQLWVDMFPVELGPPGPPVDVTPRIPIEHELRVIIWNTSDVILEETSITGESMSDIYVKGWIAGIDDPQKTDVHFRSLDGTGNFNWRFVFPFLYVPAEKVMVVRKKRHIWSKDITESRMPPKIIFQIWDNDIFSPDDFLGQLELVLTHMPKPAKSAKNCSLKQLNVGNEKEKKKNKPVETVSLFNMKRVYGWWPCVAEEDEKYELAGKIEMTLEVITSTEITEKPAGKGRSDPNLNPTLDPPNRPATSFFWFASPFKSLRYIIWRRYKWYIIGFIVFVLLLALVVLFFYSMPGYTVKKIFGV